jgi:hypothetical protein
MNNLTNAISSALDQHAIAEQHISRWEAKMAAAFSNQMTAHLDEVGLLTEGRKAVIAAAGMQLAADTVDGTVEFIEKRAGTKLDRSMIPSLLTDAYMEQRVTASVRVARKTYQPAIEKRDEAMRKNALAAPLNPSAGPSMGLDLGAYAAEQSKRFAIEDAQRAPNKPTPGGYVDPDADPLGVMAAGEAAALQRYPAKRGKR